MKKLCFINLVMMIFLFPANGAEKGKHLFILSGQSNMARLNPGISFTPAVIKKFGEKNVIVVKDAKGGKPIRMWYQVPKSGKKGKGATGVLYKKLMAKVTAAIKGQKISSVTFIWMQGERDAREKLGDVYAASFKGLLSELRKDLKRKDIKYVLGRLNDFDMNNKSYHHWTMIRDIQMAITKADKNGEWVDTDDLNDGKKKNDLHLTKDGYKVLGERFASKAIQLISK